MIAQLEAGRALAPDLTYINNNLFNSYAKAGRIQDAEKLRDILHEGILKRGDSAKSLAEWMQSYNATLAIMRQPNDYDAIQRTLPVDRVGISVMFPSHIDDLFVYAESLVNRRGTGTDGVVLLRSPLFANYHHDPRYLRLLQKTGFDDDGVPR